MTSLHLFLLILLMCVAHFWDIFTSIIPYGTFKESLASLQNLFIYLFFAAVNCHIIVIFVPKVVPRAYFEIFWSTCKLG